MYIYIYIYIYTIYIIYMCVWVCVCVFQLLLAIFFRGDIYLILVSKMLSRIDCNCLTINDVFSQSKKDSQGSHIQISQLGISLFGFLCLI